MATRVLLIRHADVENPANVLYGHLEGFGLSALGRAQAEAVGERLRDDPPVRIAHSPLQRAVETTSLINAGLAAPAPLQPEPGLREADFSRYLQGVPYWQIPMRRPLWFVHKARRGLLPGDESIEELGGRVLRVMYALAEAHPGARSALVSHADPLQAAWVLLDRRPANERELYRKAIAKSGMLEVELDGTRLLGVAYTAPPSIPRPAPPPAIRD
jgi:probable phosphoglycerate mutase